MEEVLLNGKNTSANPPIPLVDLQLQHQQIADAVSHGFEQVIKSAAFVLGEAVTTFEQSFAQFVGVKHCIGVGSGTDALEFMLRAIGIGKSGEVEGEEDKEIGEVILPTNTFIATALAVVRAGATPRLVDCDEETLLIDVHQVAQNINTHTRALLPVHLYGQMAPVEELQQLADDTGVVLLEDAAQAHGAQRYGRSAGGVGLMAATSFYPGKNLGAYGDAGAVLTDDAALDERLRQLRNYGTVEKYVHSELGFNSRLDTLQAVVLQAKLARLAAWNEERRYAAQRYDTLLKNISAVRLPMTLPGNTHVFHLYVIRVPRRDRVLQRLHQAGIQAGIHYPVPIHLQAAFRQLGHRPGDFPQAEHAAQEVLSLPLFPGISTQQQERVVQELRRALDA